MDPQYERGVTTLIAVGMKQEEAVATMNQIVTEESITSVAQEIARKRGITLSMAYREARSVQVQDPAPEGWSKRDHVLEALYRMNANAGVNPDTLLSTLKGMGVHLNIVELTSILWDQQKLQLVTFRESHAQSGSLLSRIRLTTKGRARIVEKRGTPQQAVVRVNGKAAAERGFAQSNRGGGTHAVGRDGTNFRNHRKTTDGGPVEIIVPGKKPEVIKSPEYKPHRVQMVDQLGDPLPQNMKAPLDWEPLVFSTKEAWDRKVAEIEAKTRIEGKMRPVPSLAAFPSLDQLVMRRDKKNADKAKAETMMSAAAMVAEIDPEAAEDLTAKAAALEGEPLTNEQRDILRYIDEVTGAS